LDRREGAQAGVGALKLGHDEAIRHGAQARAPVAFYLRPEDAKLRKAWNQLCGEGRIAEMRDDDRHDFALNEVADGVANHAFLVGKLRFKV